MEREAEAVIHLVRVGEVEGALLEGIARPLAECFAEEIARGGSLPIPVESWNRKREQYAAGIMLRGIPDCLEGARILGFVDVDLFAPGMNFVFGMADQARRKAVVSLWRLRQETYRLPRDSELLQKRLLTEAVHELGHTFGLAHCPSDPCVMRFSVTLAETDAKGWSLCPACREMLGRTVPARQ